MATFEELKYLGEDFYEVIRDLGEIITFKQDDGSEIDCFISLESKLAKSEITVINEYAFKGVMTFPDRLGLEMLRGSYFKREDYPEKDFIVLLTNDIIYDDRIGEVYVTECNEIIDIGYITKTQDEIGNDVDVFNVVYANVKCMYDANPKTQQSTDFGSISRDVIKIIIPAHIKITTQYKVFKKGYVSKSKDLSIPPVLDYESYSIQSIDTGLSNSLDGETRYGVLSLEIMKEV